MGGEVSEHPLQPLAASLTIDIWEASSESRLLVTMRYWNVKHFAEI